MTKAKWIFISVLCAILFMMVALLLLAPAKTEAPQDAVLLFTPPAAAPTNSLPSPTAPALTPPASTPMPAAPTPTALAQTPPTSTPTALAQTPTPAISNTPHSSAPAEGTGSEKPLHGYSIGVDPGHQAKSNRALEPVAPGSSDMKKKVSSGTYGRFTGVSEHEVNLQVGLFLQDMLKDAGATVVMTRTKADVDISNAERAQLFNKKKVDLGVRIHCNGSDDANVTGAFMLVPKSNPYKSECVRAAECILEAYAKATGIGISKGLTYRSDQTGFNWCERPIVNIEMGHMTNKEEDEKLTDQAFQKKMATGIFNGIVNYFSEK